MTIKKTALLFCVLCPLIICSCGLNIEYQSLVYIFDNESSFAIQITLSESYRYKTDDTEEKRNFPFTVYSSNVTQVYVKGKEIVDFQWTTDSAEANSKVYCVTEGSKAVFKNR